MSEIAAAELREMIARLAALTAEVERLRRENGALRTTSRPASSGPRWIRIGTEIYPIGTISSLRALSCRDGDPAEVWCFDRDGTNLAVDQATIDDVGEHDSLDDALRQAAIWDEQCRIRDEIRERENREFMSRFGGAASRPEPDGDRRP